jgi:proprotein convertase subtilisin/kexin type 5
MNSDPSKCLTCENGYLKMPLTIGTCVTTCPDGFYEQGINCLACTVTNCKDCVYLAAIRGQKCEVCMPTFSRRDDQDNCHADSSCSPNGYKLETRTHLNFGYTYKTCERCLISNCKENSTKIVLTPFLGVDCLADLTKCDDCSGALFLSTGRNACLTECPLGHGWRPNRECVECTNPSCKTCDHVDTNKCLTCLAGRNLLSLGAGCVTVCPDGEIGVDYFPARPYKYCDSCGVSNCKKCSAVGACTQCYPGYFIQPHPSGSGSPTCVSTCLPEFTANSSTRMCERCSTRPNGTNRFGPDCT